MNEELKTGIPHGPYCYEIIEIERDKKNEKPIMTVHVCPYWYRDSTKPEQMNGYCAYMDIGDWDDEGFGLLWDQVKCCGINEEYED